MGVHKDGDGVYQIINKADPDDATASNLTDIAFDDTDTTGATFTDVDLSAAVASTANTVKDIDITDVAGAQAAVLVIDDAIKSIDAQRADLGAVQNRFDNTISNLQNISENVSAARGRIQDTDFAAETANLSKNQILQQAGTAILAQANQLPQAVLSLLQ
ncbi:A-type flagellin [compost metagenome]